jgi:hypothetical protein
MRAVPRLRVMYPGICLTSEEKSWKQRQSWQPKDARLISTELDSFSWLGHHLALASTDLLTPALGFHVRRRGSALGQRRYLPSFSTRGFPTSANLESKLAVRVLMWSANSGTQILINMLASNAPGCTRS